MIIPSGRRAAPLVVRLSAVVALVGGAMVAWHYHTLGLTLTHYDARGHLVVARRIIDSITPGWQQIGAVWLPLPHLLNMLPVQIDAMYRTGASGVAISVAAFAMATASVAWIVLTITESTAAAAAAAAVFGLNPNVLYLQATPMTEPLLLALTTAAAAMLVAFVRADQGDVHPVGADRAVGPAEGRTPRSAPAPNGGLRQSARVSAPTTENAGGDSACLSAPTTDHESGGTAHRVTAAPVFPVGILFALACLTRYEAWPVTACALAIGWFVLWRRGRSLRVAARSIGAIALYPAIAIGAFFLFSRIVIGEWFVASGFFVPENKALGLPVLAAAEIWWGTHMLSGYVVIGVAAAGLCLLAIRGLAVRDRACELLPLALLATAALPWAAFVKGHPYRIRYMVPLVAVEAIGAGAATMLFGKARPIAALLLLFVAGYELHPLDPRAPMVVEAQWDRPNIAARDRVTDCLRASYDGEKVMASMGSLGHYMQEASAEGFAIRDFLHEGNGDIWLAALQHPHAFAGWLLIEEKAEGGDMLAAVAREDSHFLDGYRRVCEGAGMALYRRTATGDRRSKAGTSSSSTADRRSPDADMNSSSITDRRPPNAVTGQR